MFVFWVKWKWSLYIDCHWILSWINSLTHEHFPPYSLQFFWWNLLKNNIEAQFRSGLEKKIFELKFFRFLWFNEIIHGMGEMPKCRNVSKNSKWLEINLWEMYKTKKSRIWKYPTIPKLISLSWNIDVYGFLMWFNDGWILICSNV